MENEANGWDQIDDDMGKLDWLDDDQLHREADVMLEIHGRGEPHCAKEHDTSECFIPILIEACGLITELYKETGYLHKNNRYVLQNYLAIGNAGIIIID